MDPENQGLIKRLAEELGSEDLVVILGAADAEAVEVAAETLREGDPAFVGPLAGVQLGLAVFHIFEDAIKEQVDTSVYEEHIGFFELTFDTEAIKSAMRRARSEV
jgi:glycine/sarcosine/betaine reductase complex component A